MSSKGALFIAHGIGLAGLAGCATALEIAGKDPGILWFGVAIWVVCFFWQSWPSSDEGAASSVANENSELSDQDIESQIEVVLIRKGLLDSNGNRVSNP